MLAEAGRVPASQEKGAKILLVDDDEVMLEFLQTCLEHGMPGVAVTQYQTERLGRPGATFRWGDFDLLLLDYNLGRGDTGVEWLRTFGTQPGFPRTLLLTAEDSARVVGSAVSTGAGGYLNKSNLTPHALVETVKSMLDAPDQEVASGAEGAMDETGSAAAAGAAPDPAGPRYRGRDSLDTGPGGASYRFTRMIGRGGMSRVYLAERVEDRATVVLKILDRDVAQDPDNVLRFAREGEFIAQIDSPYVVRIYDHGFTNSYGYIAMEFFGRGDLSQRIGQGVSPEDAVLYLHNIACGLKAIHRHGIIHRDLKPGNVMFRGNGSMALVDFGLSKRIGLESSLTQAGMLMGTPYCMSPEQASGGEVDERCDVYSAGVILHKMLTGKYPFAGPSVLDVLFAIRTAPVPVLPQHLAGYQPLLERLLAKEPDDRFQSADELIASLSGFL